METIKESTIEAVKIGILTDEQLDEAIKHYSKLESLLNCHGDLYRLVWKDVFYKLHELNGYKKSRKDRK